MAGAGIHTRLRRWALETEGSTRSAALIRIGLALLVWARYADGLSLHAVPRGASLVLSACFFAATTMMLLGVASRLAAAGTAAAVLASFYGARALMPPGDWQYHHMYLLGAAAALCSLSPCGRSYSWDRWRALQRAERAGRPAPAERANLWGLRLIAIQVASIYLWSALDKLNPGYLSGDRLEGMVVRLYTGSDYAPWPGFGTLLMLGGWGVLALELALAVGLFVRRARAWLLPLGAAMHAVFYLTLPVGTFSLTMCLLYLACCDADAVHRVIDRLAGRPGPPAPGHAGGGGR